jgi:hypothetical protein
MLRRVSAAVPRVPVGMGRPRDLMDERRMLRWLCTFDYPMGSKDMRNRFPRWPGRTLDALLKDGLVRPSGRPAMGRDDGFEPTADGRRLVDVMEVMES